MAVQPEDKTRYDDPNFTVVREQRMVAVQGPAASLTDFARFRCRNKCIVKSVMVHCTSLPSAVTTWTLLVMRAGATTVNKYTVSSFSVVGDISMLLTLSTLNTLVSAGERIALQFDTTEKGKFDVTYEYQLLPPARL